MIKKEYIFLQRNVSIKNQKENTDESREVI